MLPNPYTPRSTTADPVGRDRIISKVEQSITPMLNTRTAASGGVILYGVRGIGKTSVLRVVQADAAARYGFVTVWVAAAKRSSVLTELPQIIRQALISADILKPHEWSLEKMGIELNIGVVKAKSNIGKTAHQPFTASVSGVEQLLRWAAKKCAEHGQGNGSGLLLFIDELHAVKQSELSILLNVFQNIADDKLSSPPFMFLGAGLPAVRGIATMAATFGERTLFQPVNKLNPADARVALLKPALELGVTIADEVLDVLVAAADGYPFFLQLYGWNLWNEAKPEPGQLITHSSLKAALAETQENVLELFNSRFDAATKLEREFIIAMAQLGQDEPVKRSDIAAAFGKATDGISMVRRSLIAKAIVTEEQQGYLKFTLPGFAHFVLNELS